MHPARVVVVIDLFFLSGCGEILGIDPIEYRAAARGGQGGESWAGGAAGEGGLALPTTQIGRGCTDLDVCGPDGASCCESKLIAGPQLGTYRMGCSFTPGRPCVTESMGPEHPANVGNFYLDTFEATVGRFRQFEEEYNSWRAAGNPAPDAGGHPRIAGSGWHVVWDEYLPRSGPWFDVDLACAPGFQSWRIDADARLPQNCLSWPTAFAFCVWSGGRLPSEAEWEIAATGASENRLYAWGIQAPEPDLAVYNVPEMFPPDSFWLEAAGSRPLGKGRFGHFDLTGNLDEWTLDQYSETWFKKGADGNPCDDCANVGDASDGHVVRGGSWSSSKYDLLVTEREDAWGISISERYGVRCARDPVP